MCVHVHTVVFYVCADTYAALMRIAGVKHAALDIMAALRRLRTKEAAMDPEKQRMLVAQHAACDVRRATCDMRLAKCDMRCAAHAMCRHEHASLRA